MRLSTESYILREKFGDIRALELIKEAGFDCVDFSYNNAEENSPLLSDTYREYAQKIREHLDKIELICNQAHAPFPFIYGGKFDESNPQYRDTVRAIESASILGAEYIIVHSIGIPQEVNGVDVWEYNKDFYRSLIPYCEKFGISVAVENLFKRIKKPGGFDFMGRFAKSDELCRLIRDINSPYIVGCVDTGHASLTAGEEPEDFIAGLDGKYIKAVHIQDGDYIDDRHVLPFIGDFNWEAIMRSLKKIGYNNDLTFEIFKYLKKFPNELIPDALKLAQRCGRYLISLFEKE